MAVSSLASGFGLTLTSNLPLKIAELDEAIEKFPAEIDKAVGNNAALALKQSIVEIDTLIYATPETERYSRTKNLRRSNKIKKIGLCAWLVYNDAAYAGFVHNGTSFMAARPWMKNAIDAKQQEMAENILKAGTAILAGEEGTEEPAEEVETPQG